MEASSTSQRSPVSLLERRAVDLAADVRHGRTSARTLVMAAMERAEALADTVNCVAAALYEPALERAHRIDEMVQRGEDPGPLAGVPLTIKDGIAFEGAPQTFGSCAMADVVASTSDLICRRLEAAGAIVLATSTAPEFYHRVVTQSSLHGTTRNPWSLNRTPGGSSGGAAASIAAGIVPVAIGSDGGGSLRCPAACTGILALKPTVGRVPQEGYPDTFANYASCGPMARHVDDLETLLHIVSGQSGKDALSLAASGHPLRGPDAVERRPLRIGFIPRPGGVEVDPDVRDACGDAVGGLAKAGFAVGADFTQDLLDGVFATYRTIVAGSHATRLRRLGPTRAALCEASYLALAECGERVDAHALIDAQESRTRLFRRVQAAFDDVDLIVTPTLTSPPKAADASCSVHEDEYAHWAAALHPFNLTGHPAISIPCGFDRQGLPIGLQVVAPWYREARLIEVARWLGKVLR